MNIYTFMVWRHLATTLNKKAIFVQVKDQNNVNLVENLCFHENNALKDY